jgi:hypothetical protein
MNNLLEVIKLDYALFNNLLSPVIHIGIKINRDFFRTQFCSYLIPGAICKYVQAISLLIDYAKSTIYGHLIIEERTAFQAFTLVHCDFNKVYTLD